ncbi:ER membrane protein complex subunit 8 [Dinochytrium kinnereticum]|nr:ER membrane protein complex subunit 8 [Dinochytrium kinnereticum]
MGITIHTTKTAYLKLVLHAAKYSTTAVSGLLLGSKLGEKLEVVDAIPLFHTSSPLSPLAEISLHQAEIYAEQCGSRIVGMYFANETAVDQSINPFVGKMAAKIDALLGDGSVLFMIDNAKLSSSNIAVKAYNFVSGNWKALHPNALTTDEGDNMTVLKKLITDRTYTDLVDFENHLDDIEMDWLKNSKFTLKLKV